MTLRDDFAVLECSKLMMVVYRVIIMARLLYILYDIPFVLVASQHTRFTPGGALKPSPYFTLHNSLLWNFLYYIVVNLYLTVLESFHPVVQSDAE